MEEVFEEKIFWSEQRTALKKAAVFHFHGGVDQMFREFILASQLTRWAVQCFGHDR